MHDSQCPKPRPNSTPTGSASDSAGAPAYGPSADHLDDVTLTRLFLESEQWSDPTTPSVMRAFIHHLQRPPVKQGAHGNGHGSTPLRETRRLPLKGRVCSAAGDTSDEQRAAFAVLNAAIAQALRARIVVNLAYTERAVAQAVLCAQPDPHASHASHASHAFSARYVAGADGETALAIGERSDAREGRPQLTLAYAPIRGGSVERLAEMTRAVRLMTEWLGESDAPSGIVAYLDRHAQLAFAGHADGEPFRYRAVSRTARVTRSAIV